MKEVPAINDVLENLFAYMVADYDGAGITDMRPLVFELTHQGETLVYSLIATPDALDLKAGKTESPALTVRCTAFDWIRIAGQNLNPVLASISGRLKLIGDAKLLSAVAGKTAQDGRRPIEDPPQPYEILRKRQWTPPQKVLALSGSPRGDKGYTHALLRSVLKGMARNTLEIETMTLKHKDIRVCKGCWTCWLRTEGGCIYNDDMGEMTAKIESADIVIYAFPIYVDGVPSIVKNLLDRQTARLHPYMIPGIGKTRHPRRTVRQQYYVVLSTCGFPEIETFSPVIHHFNAIAHNHHTPIIAYLLTPQANNLFENPLYYPQLVEKIEALERAGEDIVSNGKVRKKLIRKISATTAHKRTFQWQTDASRYWQDKIDNKSTSY